MKKTKNIIIIVFISIIAIIVGVIVFINLFKDENAYTVSEKKYIVDAKSELITINVLNDANVFGRDGKGVFYDFLDNFEKENGLSFDIVTTSLDNAESGLSLTKSSKLPSNSKLIYTDHYVLIGKDFINIANISEISGTIGYLSKDNDALDIMIKNNSLTLKNYKNKVDLLQGFEDDDVDYIIVPRLEYLDIVLSNLYVIDYHFSDIKDYYYILNSDDKTLASIMGKSYNRWSEENFKKSFNESEYELFINRLKITEKELDVINNKVYRYGFMQNAPYDILISGEYGGIVSKYISEFSEFSGITFKYNDYNKFNKFTKAISKGQVDLFLNYYSITTSMATIESSYTIDVSIVMNNKDFRVYNDFSSIKNETLYVEENSIISSYLKNNNINIKTYKNTDELDKILDDNKIVAMDYANYLIYKENNKNVNERFRINTRTTLNFQSNNDTMFNRLFSYYISTIDKNEILYTGIDDYNMTLTSGSIIYKITKYAFLLMAAIGIGVYFFYKIGKRAIVRKKIKRSDKMKYIDLLTSLKNRNYLSENVPIWNQNTIYPQAVVVVDLNCVQELNDMFGYKEGDKQIQAAANVLIKTQLDNSEIMRTDGNEFTIYLVGYSEKQVISYIKKLNKEFKNLPHDRGAAIGFSIIEDDVKLITDAVNEATEKMKANKALVQGDADEEKF